MPWKLMHCHLLIYPMNSVNFVCTVLKNRSFSFLCLTMVRKKLLMKKIDNPSSRQVTYSKRRDGIVKKATELSVLCGTDVGLLMFSPTGRLTCFASNGRLIIFDNLSFIICCFAFWNTSFFLLGFEISIGSKISFFVFWTGLMNCEEGVFSFHFWFRFLI